MNGAQKKTCLNCLAQFFLKNSSHPSFHAGKKDQRDNVFSVHGRNDRFFFEDRSSTCISAILFQGSSSWPATGWAIPLALKAIYCNWNRTDLYFLKVNPPKQGLFQSKTGHLGSRYVKVLGAHPKKQLSNSKSCHQKTRWHPWSIC